MSLHLSSLLRKFSPCLPFCFLISLALPLLKAQSRDVDRLAALQGIVRDAQQHPVPSAIVHLEKNDGTSIAQTTTDASGSYSFTSLSSGPYKLKAESSGRGNVELGLFLKPGETKRIDLTFDAAKSANPQSPSQPEFFDEPQFTVAGVSDTTNFGGHGSDTVVRTTESLAKETATLRGGSPALSSTAAENEKPLRDAVEHNPESFQANHQLGTYLLAANKAHEGIPYLEKASRLNSTDYQNAYQLALAYANVGDFPRARSSTQALLTRLNKPELHHLLADIEDKQGHPVEAAREYQRAAELSASEPNLFDWGAELLVHSAIEPAIEVFSKGVRLFPRSSRMLMGLGVAQYGRGFYDQAVHNLCQASDLNPDDPAPYLFLGKLQVADSTASRDSLEKLARFARLHPENALANYYYAVSLWRQRKAVDAESSSQVELHLQKAIELDSKLGSAYLQLGILYAERKDLAKAIFAYRQAIKAEPRLEQAHYRLAQAYRQAGETAKALQELQTYQQISKETAQQVAQERHDIQQLVYTLRDAPSESRAK